jgi:hypothetical protein
MYRAAVHPTFRMFLLVGVISVYLTPTTLSSKLYGIHLVVCIESVNMTFDTRINERDNFLTKKNMYIFMLQVSTCI